MSPTTRHFKFYLKDSDIEEVSLVGLVGVNRVTIGAVQITDLQTTAARIGIRPVEPIEVIVIISHPYTAHFT